MFELELEQFPLTIGADLLSSGFRRPGLGLETVLQIPELDLLLAGGQGQFLVIEPHPAAAVASVHADLPHGHLDQKGPTLRTFFHGISLLSFSPSVHPSSYHTRTNWCQ
jgi:hypothetical protein